MTVICFYCGDAIPDTLPHVCEGCGARLTLRLTSDTPMEKVDAAARLNGYRMGMHYTGAEALQRVQHNQGFLTYVFSGQMVPVPEASA
jgi:hypothetical protein